jgi:hypothetical protein
MAASFADSKPLVDDFCVVLQSDDTEQGLLGEVVRHRAAAEAASAAHAANAKHIIAELQRRVRQTEAAAAAAAPSIDELRAKFAQIESRRAALAAEVARLRQQKDTSSTALQALTQQMASLKQASATLLGLVALAQLFAMYVMRDAANIEPAEIGRVTFVAFTAVGAGVRITGRWVSKYIGKHARRRGETEYFPISTRVVQRTLLPTELEQPCAWLLNHAMRSLLMCAYLNVSMIVALGRDDHATISGGVVTDGKMVQVRAAQRAERVASGHARACAAGHRGGEAGGNP